VLGGSLPHAMLVEMPARHALVARRTYNLHHRRASLVD
jgi:hypothetical protein